MSRLVLLLALAVAVAGLTIAISVPRHRAPGPSGYRVRGDRVVFEFRPRQWPVTTMIASGDTVPMRDLRVRRVCVVGPFNDWTPGAWPLAADEGVWRLRRPARAVAGERLTFAFVVNDRFWVEPAPASPNRVEAPLAGGRRGLRLLSSGAR